MTGKTIAIIESGSSAAERTLLESMRALDTNIIIVDSAKDVAELLKGTSYPDLKPHEPMKIKAPELIEMPLIMGEFTDGQTSRRERRAKERKNKK